jgi:hypothetical protein
MDQCLINTSAVSAFSAVKDFFSTIVERALQKNFFFAKQSQTYTAWAIWAIPTPRFYTKNQHRILPDDENEAERTQFKAKRSQFFGFSMNHL